MLEDPNITNGRQVASWIPQDVYDAFQAIKTKERRSLSNLIMLAMIDYIRVHYPDLYEEMTEAETA